MQQISHHRNQIKGSHIIILQDYEIMTIFTSNRRAPPIRCTIRRLQYFPSLRTIIRRPPKKFSAVMLISHLCSLSPMRIPIPVNRLIGY